MATAKLDQVKGALTPNIGISDSARQQIIDILNKRLADTFVLYVKTLNYHWNVTGTSFQQLHGLFREQYEALAESIDEIAERVRKVGGFTIGTLDEFKQNALIEEKPGHIPSAEDMVRDLLHDHEACIRQLRADADKVDELGDAATNDFLIELVEDHETTAWMLRARLENATR